VVEDSTATADLVIADVLDQFARNFLLNDLTTEKSGKLLEAARGESVSRCRGERLVEETPSLVRFIKRASACGACGRYFEPSRDCSTLNGQIRYSSTVVVRRGARGDS